jgi:Bacterial Ig domain
MSKLALSFSSASLGTQDSIFSRLEVCPTPQASQPTHMRCARLVTSRSPPCFYTFMFYFHLVRKARRAMRLVFLSGCLLLLLVSCNKETIPPSVAISSPASGSTVSSSVPIQIGANADAQVSRVDVYVRGKGSKNKGVLVGSAAQEPFVVNWVTSQQPNGANLELVAVGIDAQGREGTAPPVEVKTQNGNVPAFKLLAAYTIAPAPAGSSLEAGSLPAHVEVAEVEPPLNPLPTAVAQSGLSPQIVLQS